MQEGTSELSGCIYAQYLFGMLRARLGSSGRYKEICATIVDHQMSNFKRRDYNYVSNPSAKGCPMPHGAPRSDGGDTLVKDLRQLRTL